MRRPSWPTMIKSSRLPGSSRTMPDTLSSPPPAKVTRARQKALHNQTNQTVRVSPASKLIDYLYVLKDHHVAGERTKRSTKTAKAVTAVSQAPGVTTSEQPTHDRGRSRATIKSDAPTRLTRSSRNSEIAPNVVSQGRPFVSYSLSLAPGSSGKTFRSRETKDNFKPAYSTNLIICFCLIRHSTSRTTPASVKNCLQSDFKNIGYVSSWSEIDLTRILMNESVIAMKAPAHQPTARVEKECTAVPFKIDLSEDAEDIP